MSITKSFREQWLPMVRGTHVRRATLKLFDHARALEAMLKSLEWQEDQEDITIRRCPECGAAFDYPFRSMEHISDCQLAKLLEGVEEQPREIE